MKQTLLIALAAAAFAAVAFFQLQAEGAFECEVCMEMEGRRACGSVAAPTRNEALARAISLACGIVTTGVTRTLECERGTPTSYSCQEH